MIIDDAKLAYNTLSNPMAREEYDNYLKDHLQMASYQRRHDQSEEKKQEKSNA